MSKIRTISDREVKTLRDLQVSFSINADNNVTILQVESHSEFTGFYEALDFYRISPKHLIRLEQICKNWFEAQENHKEFEQDEIA